MSDQRFTQIIRRWVRQFIQNLDLHERSRLWEWALRVQVVLADTSLSRGEKVRALAKLETTPVVGMFFRFIWSASRQELWEDRSWATRFAVIGLAVGLATGGSSAGAGVAAFGNVVGVPLFLLSAAGGALLGVIIDELASLRRPGPHR